MHLNELFFQLKYAFSSLIWGTELNQIILYFFPFIILFELPFYAMIIVYAIRGWLKQTHAQPIKNYRPKVTCVICGYNEGDEIILCIKSLIEQIYKGYIEILVIIDDAINNKITLDAAEAVKNCYPIPANRLLKIIPKEARCGHANSLNLGLQLATGELIVSIDGDTSVDNDMIQKSVLHFSDNNVIALSGSLRPRNLSKNILTLLQGLEYMIGIFFARFGLSELRSLNMISGALGIFRTSFVRRLGGWRSGTAEDLDLMIRISTFYSRYPNLEAHADPRVVGLTEVPETWRQLFKQRQRWDGDIFYMYARRHWRRFSSRILGWKVLITYIWYGLFLQLILPFMIIIYFIYVLLFYHFFIFFVVIGVTYLYYLFMVTFIYIIYILLASQRKLLDIKLMPLCLLMPVYQFIMRIISAFFILNEIIFQTHKETSMTPWWVIKKTK